MKCNRLIPKSRFSIASVLYTSLFATTIIYFEFVQVWLNASNWKDLKYFTGIRILIVADPQLLGEHRELPLIGTYTRWHSDRYIRQNYKVTKYYTDPHIVIFLGDLFDEGSIATPDESERYLRRFQSVFQLDLNETAKKIVYIHLPGDNDVGGEGKETINPSRLKWFNRTFGNIQSPVTFQKTPLNLKFLKTNLLFPTLDSNPSNSEISVEASQTIKIALSHYPCGAAYESCAKMLQREKPHILLSAHTHDATYYQYNSKGNVKYVLPSLLRPSMTSIAGTYEAAKRMGLELFPNHIRLDLRNQSVFHEFLSPTCSYRMGTQNVGFGLVTISENGYEAAYEILWLPNGFQPLVVYITFYIVSKLVFTPWILYRFLHWVWPKLSRFLIFNIGRSTNSSLHSDKTHLV